MDLSLKIDVVKNIAKEEFKKNYLIPQKPVVLKGIADNTSAGKKWCLVHHLLFHRQIQNKARLCRAPGNGIWKTVAYSGFLTLKAHYYVRSLASLLGRPVYLLVSLNSIRYHM